MKQPQQQVDRVRHICTAFISDSMLAKLITQAIDELCNTECEHCQCGLTLPDQERIEDWLRGKK